MEVYQASLFPDTDIPLSENNEVTLFALVSIKGVGFATVKALVDEFNGDVNRVWWAPSENLSGLLYDVRTPNSKEVVEQIKSNGRQLIADARKTRRKYLDRGIRLLLRNSPSYPNRLLDLPNPPSWLFVEGDVSLLNEAAMVAVVGTRNPTEHGVAVGRRAAMRLAQSGAVVVSGLAEGIDATGHEVSVLYGAPTVAVLGHGVDEVFPKTTAGLREKLVRHGGAVVSEYLPWDSYSRDKFVMRNRIQAALSHAVCIVEAQEKSGTAHTYRFAKQLERMPFGVRIGDWREVPEEGLLRMMEMEGRPIFDLATEEGADAMLEFVSAGLESPSRSRQTDAPRLFKAMVQEIENVAHTFGATEADFKYLLKEIGRIKRQHKPTEGHD